MEEIKNGIPIIEFQKEFIKVSDLIYFEGPLLSHFQTPSNDHFLFYWVDVDDKYNRWLVFRVGMERLQSYVNGGMSLFNLISKPEDGFVYKIDINNDLEYNNPMIVFVSDLPENYLPNKGVLYTFTPTNSELNLSIYSRKYNSGILQAYLKNSAKTPYNEIDIKLFGTTLYALSEIRDGLSKFFVNETIKSSVKDKNGKTNINRDLLKKSTEINFFASAGGSFSALFKSASKAVPMEGFISDEDNFMIFFMKFINSSNNFEELTKLVQTIDKKIISNYKWLLSTIIASKLNFFLKWENAITHVSIKEDINFGKAKQILSVIEQVEYDNGYDVKITGKFIALNTINGKYEFQDSEDEENISSGKMDKERQEMSGLIDFKLVYDVVISRRETKQAGNKTPVTEDVLVSFVAST